MRITILGVCLFLALCGQAVARPRDDVMINAYRCAGHASTRTWLDCYYGAAQPQRAALGLPPAPTAQVQLTSAPPAPGQPQDLSARDAVMAAAARCGSVVAERPWLDCYYAAANPVRALLGLALMPGAAPPPESPARPAAPRSTAGFLDRFLDKPDLRVDSHLASYRFDRNGFFIVTLENGESWRQIDGDSYFAHWSRKPRSYAVTITGGAFGSFKLTVKGNPVSYKVERVS